VDELKSIGPELITVHTISPMNIAYHLLCWDVSIYCEEHFVAGTL